MILKDLNVLVYIWVWQMEFHPSNVKPYTSQAIADLTDNLCNGPCWDRTPVRSLQRATSKPLGHKGTWTTQSLTRGWFVTLLSPFWNPSPLARMTFNQGGELSLRRTRVTAATSVADRAGIEPRVARFRGQRLNHPSIKVPEWPSRLRKASSLQPVWAAEREAVNSAKYLWATLSPIPCWNNNAHNITIKKAQPWGLGFTHPTE